jgi:hypothetical protein
MKDRLSEGCGMEWSLDPAAVGEVEVRRDERKALKDTPWQFGRNLDCQLQVGQILMARPRYSPGRSNLNWAEPKFGPLGQISKAAAVKVR